jgi:hypothetical protein
MSVAPPLSTCTRLWEASALEDCRLSGADRASYERHAASCDACRAELAQLAELRRQLSLVAPPPPNPFMRAQARGHLLRRAYEGPPEPRDARHPWTLAAVAGVVLTVGVAGAAGFRAHRTPDEDVIRPVPTTSPPPVVPASGDSPLDIPASASLAQPPAPRPATARPASAKSIPAPPASAGILFDAAVASFEAGDLERADAELARFGRTYPEDARSEDAAYLRAVAHSRMGDRTGAAKLARAYLAAYPTGLRRPEAQRIADATP